MSSRHVWLVLVLVVMAFRSLAIPAPCSSNESIVPTVPPPSPPSQLGAQMGVTGPYRQPHLGVEGSAAATYNPLSTPSEQPFRSDANARCPPRTCFPRSSPTTPVS